MVLQRVSRARVSVDGETVGGCGAGVLVFLGVAPADDPAVARHLAARVAALRIFPDERGRMNRSLLETRGEALVVSQFTLFGDARRGHRPSFLGAGPPERAARICSEFAVALRELGVGGVGEGRFGAQMSVEAVNDGPVTMVLTSAEPAWEADCG